MADADGTNGSGSRERRRHGPRSGIGRGGLAGAVHSALPLVGLLVAVAACGDGAEGPAAAVRDSAGVRIVESTGEDRPLGTEAVRVAELAPPDSALTAAPWGIAADPAAGRVYVADRTGHRVAVFDRDGDFVRQIGRRGEGPGEFRSPAAVTLDRHGALTVLDTGRGILSTWSSAGELLNERRARFGYWGPGIALGEDRLYTVTAGRPGSEQVREQRLVARGPEGTEVIRTLSRELVRMELCVSAPAPEVGAPDVVWSGRGDTVRVRRGPGYRVDVFVGGSMVRSVRRRIEPLEVTRATAVRWVRRGPGPYRGLMRRCGVDAGRIVDEVGHVETTPPVMSLAADPAGRLWVTRTPDGVRPGPVDVFGADGAYRGTLEVPGMPVAFLAPDRFVALRIEEGTARPVPVLLELRASAAGGDGGEAGSGEAAADASAAGSAGPDVSDRPEWAPPVREDLRRIRDCEVCPVMVELPAGSYTMGAPEGEAPADEIPTRPEETERAERPRVEVTIEAPFAIGEHEVTFAQWDRCVEAGGCEHEPDDEGWGRGDRPVIHVTRTDAKQYAAWLSERTGETYRLPSEAEWEYAARAGTGTARWWGDELGEGRVPCDGCGTRRDGESTAPVGSYPANPWGLHDMLSNVEEWTADCWHPSHEGHPGDGSARVESSEWWREEGWEDRRGLACRRPVTRGGAFGHFPWTIRAAHRYYYWPHPNWTEREGDARGFRLVREVSSGDGG